MFSANDSWLSSFIPGRSSDLAIIALRRLPGQCPVTWWRRTSALQRRVRAGFAPASLFTRALPRTPRTLCSLETMIAHKRCAVKGKRRSRLHRRLSRSPFSPIKGREIPRPCPRIFALYYFIFFFICFYFIGIRCIERIRMDAYAFTAFPCSSGCWRQRGCVRRFRHSVLRLHHPNRPSY